MTVEQQDFLTHQIQCFLEFIKCCIYGIYTKLVPIEYLPHKDIKGKTVLVTGSGRGLGRQLALKFGQMGCRVVLWSRTAGPNEEVYQELIKSGVEAHIYNLDITDKAAVKAAAEKVRKEVGFVDILVNNAGIAPAYCCATMPSDDLDNVMKTNFMSTHYVTTEFLPEMMRRDEGHLVSLSSVSGIISIPFQAAYSASKHALNAYFNSLTCELNLLKSNVKTTVVSPYIIKTEMTKGFKSSSIPNVITDFEPEYVIDQIIHAIQTDQTEIYMGQIWYYIKVILSSIPWSAHFQLQRFIGLDTILSQIVTNEIPKKTLST